MGEDPTAPLEVERTSTPPTYIGFIPIWLSCVPPHKNTKYSILGIVVWRVSLKPLYQNYRCPEHGNDYKIHSRLYCRYVLSMDIMGGKTYPNNSAQIHSRGKQALKRLGYKNPVELVTWATLQVCNYLERDSILQASLEYGGLLTEQTCSCKHSSIESCLQLRTLFIPL